MAVQDVESALREFLEVQTCRAQLYTRFQDGFKAFLRTKHEGQYKALMADLTAAFSECSRQVIALEGALSEMGRTDLATTLRSVQESERDKLRLTLTLQALKQAAAFRTFSWQQRKPQQGGGAEDDDDDDDDEALALLDPHLAVEAARGGCTHGHGHGHGHSHGCGHGHRPGHAEAPPPAPAAEGAGSSADERAAAGATDTRAPAGPCSRASCAALANGGSQAGGSCGAAQGGDGGGGEGGVDGSGCGAGGGGSANGGGGGGTTAAAAAPGGAPEPTRREFEAAVKEAMQGLDACIRSINEAIGDVRMELEDS